MCTEDSTIIKFYIRDPKTKTVRLGRSMEEFQEIGRRVVKKIKVGDKIVSTVFLVIDHAHGSGVPILWETMVYREDGGFYDLQLRYTSEENAEIGHTRVVKYLQDGGDPDEYEVETEEEK